MKTYRFKSLLLAMMLSALSLTTMAYDFMVDGIAYNKNSDGKTLTVTYTVYNSSNNYSGLTTANIPASVSNGGITYSVTSISSHAFEYCKGLTSVTIGNSVTAIGDYAFCYCSGLTSVTIPNSVTFIGDCAFQYCSGLTSLTIPNSVTSISNCAFQGCSGLTSVTIGNSVTTIGNQAFSGCSSLTKLTWNAVNCSSNGSMTTSNIETVTIGNQVQVLPAGFARGSKITSVTIPNSVTTIGSNAFSGCSGLTRLTWNAVNCSSNGDMPNGIETVTIGNQVQVLPNNFVSGSKITSVIIPNSVTFIGDCAFQYCSGLTSLTIPNSVTSISNSAFSGCSGLTSVTIPNSVTAIGNNAFESCSSLTSVTIPNSVTSIGSNAFGYCSSLKRLNIPGSVSDIGARAFASCTGLMTVRIANCTNSTVVGSEAFYHCEGLTSVILPASLSSLGVRAFEGCTGLTDVTCMRQRPVNIDTSVFKDVPVNGGCDLHVPQGSKIRYEAMAVWQDFLFIFEDAHDDEPTPTPTNGDVNGDGKVNVSDVTTLVNMILGVN